MGYPASLLCFSAIVLVVLGYSLHKLLYYNPWCLSHCWPSEGVPPHPSLHTLVCKFKLLFTQILPLLNECIVPTYGSFHKSGQTVLEEWLKKWMTQCKGYFGVTLWEIRKWIIGEWFGDTDELYQAICVLHASHSHHIMHYPYPFRCHYCMFVLDKMCCVDQYGMSFADFTTIFHACKIHRLLRHISHKAKSMGKRYFVMNL